MQTLRRQVRPVWCRTTTIAVSISSTWFTWLEQGRGGGHWTDALESIACGLVLTVTERERLFILAFRHRPEPRYNGHARITPRLQHVLDARHCSSTIFKTATWHVVAWRCGSAVK